MRTSHLLPIFLLMSTTAVQAADSKDDATQEEKEDKMVCRTEKVTGSLTRRTRVCMKASEWSALAEATRQKLDKQISQGYRRVGETIDPGFPTN